MRYALQEGCPAQDILAVTPSGVEHRRGHVPAGGAWHDGAAIVPAALGEGKALQLFRRWMALVESLKAAFPSCPARREGDFKKVRITVDGKIYTFQSTYGARTGWGGFGLVTYPEFLPAEADVRLWLWVPVPPPSAKISADRALELAHHLAEGAPLNEIEDGLVAAGLSEEDAVDIVAEAISGHEMDPGTGESPASDVYDAFIAALRQKATITR